MRNIIIVLFIFILCFCSFGYAQETAQAPQVNTVQGAVVDTDWVAGELVVRSIDFFTPDEMTFTVDRNTKIVKGTEAVSLADILQNSQVTVMYSASLAGLKALQINIQE